MGSRLTNVFLIAIFVQGIAGGADAPAQPQPFHSSERALAIFGPRPDYPYQARVRGITGSGIVVMQIDSPTGNVKSAIMAMGTGSPILDDTALYAFRRWRFKAGTLGPVKVPITFTTGGPPVFEYRVEQKPMDEVLAHFLGKGVVLKGPIPAYPRFPPWTEKHGQGVYELHVQKDGSVAEVKILKPSGDDRFDRVAVGTLRKWRLRRGPLILELPLNFTLTPTSYSVNIPKKH